MFFPKAAPSGRVLPAAFFFVSCVLLLPAPGAFAGPDKTASPAAAGRSAPSAKPVASLPATRIDGTTVDIAAQKGWKVIYFWSDACPCVQACERLSLMPLSRQYKDKVTFYGIAASPSNITRIGSPPRPALKTSGGARQWPAYDIVMDPDQTLLSTLGATVASETFVLDPSNRIVFRGGPDDSTEYEKRTGKEGLSQNYLADALAEALAGKPITRPVAPIAGCVIEPRTP